MKATVECYNPRTNEWTYVAKMNEPHYGHAGTVYGGYMYISGKTLPRDQCDSGVQCVEVLKGLITDQMSKWEFHVKKKISIVKFSFVIFENFKEETAI